MSIKFNPSLLSIALLSAYSCASYAQTNTSTELPTVVVTASRLPQTLSDTIANTTLITRSDIERSGAVDLPSLLSGQAGVEIARNGGPAQTASIFIRGADSKHVLVLVDGIAINDNSTGAAAMDTIPLEAIDRLEIVRGNVSAQYGSQAIGGVIQVFTRLPKKGVNAVISAELGTQGHRKIITHLAAGNESTQISLTASKLNYDGVSAMQESQQQLGTNTDKDGAKQSLLQIAVGHNITKDIRVFAGHTTSSINAKYDNAASSWSLSPITDDDSFKQSVNISKLGLNWSVNSFWKMNLLASLQNGKADYATNGVVNYSYENRRQLNTLNNEFNVGKYGTVLLGADFQSDNIAASTSAVTRQTQAIYTAWNGKIGAYGWDTSVRYDHEKNSSQNTATSYRLGGSYDLDTNWSVRGSKSNAFNRPTLDQLYGQFSPNPALKPETAKNQEFGIQWQKSENLARLTAFESKTDNLIISQPYPLPTANLGKSSNKGVELMLETKMPWQAGKMRVGFTSQNPWNVTKNTALDRRAKTLLNLGLQGNIDKLSWDLNATYQGNRNDVDYSGYPYVNVVLKSYAKLDAQVRYNFSQRLNVSLALSNLGKANDQTAYGYSGTPRSAVLRLNYKL